ncbi:MAG: reprolysin-like metallopeptidase, partial [Bacteroidota bacterium]
MNPIYILFAAFSFCFTTLHPQSTKTISLPWQKISEASVPSIQTPRIHANNAGYFSLNTEHLIDAFQGIAYREGKLKGFVAEVQFPYPDGSLHTFSVKRNQTMHPEYNAKFPEIMTFDAYPTDGSGAYGKWDITPSGLHAMIFIPGQSTVFIDPLLEGDATHYVVYRKKDFTTVKQVLCDVQEALETKPEPTVKTMFGTCELRTYRLALSATAEYTTFHGGTVAQAAAAQVVTMNRVNGVYEKDIAITMVIIPNNNSIIYTNASTDPFTNGNTGSMINQNQSNTDNVIGSANYDIGHVFGTNSGGLAGLGVVCTGGQKARGV